MPVPTMAPMPSAIRCGQLSVGTSRRPSSCTVTWSMDLRLSQDCMGAPEVAIEKVAHSGASPAAMRCAVRRSGRKKAGAAFAKRSDGGGPIEQAAHAAHARLAQGQERGHAERRAEGDRQAGDAGDDL